MKTVAIVAYAEAGSGGINQYALSMLQALRKDDAYRYVIVTRPDNHEYDNLGFDVWRLTPPKVLRRLGHYLLLGLHLRKPWFLKKRDRELLGAVDLFISPAISPYPYYFIDRPFIFTFHDMQERYYPKFFTRVERLRRFLYARGLVHSAAKIIIESRHVRQDLKKFWQVSEERTLLLPAPPPTDILTRKFCTAEAELVRVKYQLPAEYLIYPAQLWPHKNHRTLLEALVLLRENHPDLRLVLTGFDTGKADSLDAMLQEFGLQEAVVSLGYIDYQELIAVYKFARVLVMPSLFESISLPVYESFALEVPVTCSNVVALPEQVGDAGLLFDPLDAPEMANKIAMILDDSLLAKKLVARGLARINAFSHEQYASQLCKLVDSLGR